MKSTSISLFSLFTLTLFTCLWLGVAHAQAPMSEGIKLNDHAALVGLHEAKGLFLIDVNNPVKVSHVLRVIGLTRKGLANQGVTPHLIVVFIGPAVAFLTRDRRGIGYQQERAVSEIQNEVAGLAHQGISFEACGVALKGMDVSPKTLIPAIKPVGNGFISAIAYEAKGYSLVPVY